MTPEERAQELLQKFKFQVVYGVYLSTEQCKQCALICVDEIIEAIDWDPFQNVPCKELDYWLSVQSSIKSM